MNKLIVMGLVLLCCALRLPAENAPIIPVQPTEDFKNRLECTVFYEQYSPKDVYGENKSVLLDYYSMPFTGFTWFCEGGFYSRIDGGGAVGIAGAYRDWSPWFYTYSALSAGTDSPYLQAFRADNDCNFKVGAKKNIVLTLGGTYMKAHDEHLDTVISPGITVYMEKWILSYRYLQNTSDPGGFVSGSTLLSAAYGQEGKSWIYLNCSAGGQGYLATYAFPPQQVSGNVTSVELKYRKWLKKSYGYTASVAYLELQDSYKKYTMSFGVFKNF